MRVFNILTVSKNIFPKNFNINKNTLYIYWSENEHQSKFKLKWLRNNCYTELNNKKYNSPYIFWDGNLKKYFNKIKIDHDKIVTDDKYLKKWLELLHTYGFSIVKNAPTTKKSGFKILKELVIIERLFWHSI